MVKFSVVFICDNVDCDVREEMANELGICDFSDALAKEASKFHRLQILKRGWGYIEVMGAGKQFTKLLCPKCKKAFDEEVVSLGLSMGAKVSD